MTNVDNLLFLYKNKLDEENKKLKTLRGSMSEVEAEHKNLLEVRAFFSTYLDKMTVERIKLLEETINYGLKFVFGYAVTVEIQKQYKNNKTFFSLIINNDDVSGDADSHGGGVLAIVSFLFKFVVLTKFNYIKFMVMDESLSFVSHQYQERTSLLIRELADKFGVDILLVSHQPKLNTHSSSVYELDKKSKKAPLMIVNHRINKKEESYE